MSSWGAGAFPFFSILEEYDPKEALELRGKNRFPLLILDDQFFPMFMDWALSCNDNTEDLVLFLSETDSFRFNTSLKSDYRNGIDIKRLENVLIDTMSYSNLYAGEEYLSILHRVGDMGLNIPALYDIALQYLWNELLQRGQKIHKSNVWISFKKKIHSEVSIDIYTLLNDDHHSIYFESFLSSNSHDVLCLECWRDVRHVIATLQVLKIPDPKSGRKDIFQMWKKDDISTEHPMGGGTSNTHYTKPYEALEVMLPCATKYHDFVVRKNCSGVSENTKVRLIGIIEKNKSIRGQIKSLELKFALNLCNTIEELFLCIEKETFSHLKTNCFLKFIGEDVASSCIPSNDYVALLSSVRLKSSENVKSYLRKLAFLQEVQSGKLFRWENTGNCLFVPYSSRISKKKVHEKKKKISHLEFVDENGGEMLCSEDKVCEQCGTKFKSYQTVVETPMCQTCLSVFFRAPFIAVEFHLTTEASSRSDSDKKTTTTTTPWKYVPPPDRGKALPSRIDPVEKNTLKIEKHCWAVPPSINNIGHNMDDIRFNLVDARYSDKKYSSEQMKNVRFDLSDNIDCKPMEDTDSTHIFENDDAGAKCCEPYYDFLNAVSVGNTCNCFYTHCIKELYFDMLLARMPPDTSLEGLLVEIMRNAGDGDGCFPTSRRNVIASNDKNLLSSYENFVDCINKSLPPGKSKQVTRDISMLYIGSQQTFLTSTKCVLTVAISPYPLLEALNDIIDNMSKLHELNPNGDESVLSAELVVKSSEVLASALQRNNESSMSILVEYWGYRENFLEYYASGHHLNSAAIVESDVFKNINSRMHFCDFSLVSVLMTVSIKVLALIIVELCRNRSVILHSYSQEKCTKVIAALVCLMHPLEFQKFYRIGFVGYSSLCRIVNKMIREGCGDSLLVGCYTCEAMKLCEIKRIATEQVFTQFDLDNDMTRDLFGESSTYNSININKLLHIPSHVDLVKLIEAFQKSCRNYQDHIHDKDGGITLRFNDTITSIFKTFLNDLLLKKTSESLKLYPDKNVISCDVAALMQHALENAAEHARYGNEAVNVLCDRKYFIEDVVDSPCFVDFVIRHGRSLHIFD